jgi:signal peptidase II
MDVKSKLRGAWVVPAALALDRVAKAWAAGYAGGAREIIPGILGYRYAENTGAAFSIFSGITQVIALLTAILIAGVLLYLFLGKSIPTAARYGLWFVVAGGLGNLYDRVFYGYVVDFFNFLFIRFAIFNVADICVTCGAVLAIASFLWQDARKGVKDVQAD